MPRIQIGVMGSSGGRFAPGAKDKAYQLGREIARVGAALLTGACPGLPHAAVLGCKDEDGLVVGVSPALSLQEHVEQYHSPSQGYDVLMFTGSGLMGREIEAIRSCDIVVLVGGRSGTLGEFAIAYDEGRTIGVLQGTGGIADHVDELIALANKDTGATILYDADPERLIQQCLTEYYRRHDTGEPIGSEGHEEG